MHVAFDALLRQQNNFGLDIASSVGFKLSFQIHIFYNIIQQGSKNLHVSKYHYFFPILILIVLIDGI